MAKTQTQTKPAKVTKAKAAPKAKAATKPQTMMYAAILAEALAGKFGAIIQRFYVNALSYHGKQKTTFPRAKIATVALMSADDARAFIEKHAVTSIPPGSHPSQRLFDEMMVETQKLAQAKATEPAAA